VGVNGSDRVTLVWPDGVVRKQWLQVTVRANANTGLSADDVFYFGNAIGESGNWVTATLVNSVDEVGARHHPRGPSNPAPVIFRWDYNRDGRVNLTDVRVARANRTTAASALRLITVPVDGPAAPARPVGARRAPSSARPASASPGNVFGAQRIGGVNGGGVLQVVGEVDESEDLLA
jgi:hypothetical protein